MAEYYDQLPKNIQDHIKQITKTSNLGDNEESYELIAKGWKEKMDHFEAQLSLLKMKEVDSHPSDDEKGALILTYSGSLLNIGPNVDGSRKVEYTSIGLRKDVPESASGEGAVLKGDVNIDEEVEFSSGPIKKSSPAYKIAILKESMDAPEEEEALANATQIMAEGFVEVNKTIVM